ncbi:rhomboid family intramembrane serine protease [Pelagicoccus sp. SDUM812002]|uniref:rhomboid family intramembrane serine protease n=1 Tax=Pelagicoccus sp. SDUM812002 TaxID=3041266 RepID=UPI00280FEDCB|nr:rhomboid family intramembrane serine protease [Pelagicoccus sp. SDUM812002]MDQ8185245.1 rhomboid family intramembrane serine protease [Pelagicoccus sp. SDUM812002]
MTAPVTLAICAITAIVTQVAFSKPEILQRLLFKPREILANGQWDRILSSALIHADWMHAGFNLFAFYSFGSAIEVIYGWKTLLVVYLFSVIGGSMLSLFLHRHHSYSALGASGGVSGVIFATIFLVPGTGVSLFFIPIAIPGNVFALIYLIGSFWGLRKNVGNIGHDAHFGGAIVGLVFAFAIRPSFCLADPLYFLGSILVSIACLAILFIDPTNSSGSLLPRSKPERSD